MKTQSAKGKGRKLQQHIRDRIYHYFPELEEGDVESRPMGSGGVDIMMSPKARRLCPLSIEAKNTKDRPGKGEFEQSEYNAYKDTLPVVAWKPPRAEYTKGTLVLVRLETLLHFLKHVPRSE